MSMTKTISELALSMGLKSNPLNKDDKALTAIWDKVFKDIRSDMDAIGSAFQSDSITYDQYCDSMTKKRNQAVEEFYKLVGEAMP